MKRLMLYMAKCCCFLSLLGCILGDISNYTHSLVYNIISTPRGGQFQVALPDGRKVWLNNAATSVRFPVTFNASARKVEITGEAYFEVASANCGEGIWNMNVAVLGTMFNVNAYADERKVNTTLLEGRVKVSLHDRVLTMWTQKTT